MTTRDDLLRVLDLDEKATGDYWVYQDQGPWDDDPIIQAVKMNAEGTYPDSLTAICHNIEGDDRPDDLGLIALYRTLAPAMARQLVEIHEATDQYEGSTNPTDGAEFFFAIKSILGR